MFGEMGEMLVTHFGFSGPVILSASAHMKKHTPYTLAIDLKPALDLQKLSDRILRDFEKFDKKHFQNALGDLLPQKLIPVVVRRCGIDPHKQACQISRKEREDLAFLLKHFTARISGFRPIDEAIGHFRWREGFRGEPLHYGKQKVQRPVFCRRGAGRERLHRRF